MSTNIQLGAYAEGYRQGAADARETFRRLMPVATRWRIVFGLPGAPEYWPLVENTSVVQVANLLLEARKTWPDAYAESCPVGRWEKADPFERAPRPNECKEDAGSVQSDAEIENPAAGDAQ